MRTRRSRKEKQNPHGRQIRSLSGRGSILPVKRLHAILVDPLVHAEQGNGGGGARQHAGNHTKAAARADSRSADSITAAA